MFGKENESESTKGWADLKSLRWLPLARLLNEASIKLSVDLDVGPVDCLPERSTVLFSASSVRTGQIIHHDWPLPRSRQITFHSPARVSQWIKVADWRFSGFNAF